MRLDKYLKVTGIIKRRTLATEACRRGLVKINNSTAKVTSEVAAGDIIDINLAHRAIQIKVIKPVSGNSLKKALRPEYFTILKDEKVSRDYDFDDFWKDNLDQ
ncbi:MAG: S4 domain-containing protein [Candidatus Rifleibacteriota bacterium]